MSSASAATGGTGYGGQADDQSKLRRGRKRAADRESKRDERTIKYLRKMHRTLTSDGSKMDDVAWLSSFLGDGGESAELVTTLTETFRNQIPTDWGDRSTLYRAALDVCAALASDLQLGTMFGVGDDADSLLSALTEFARHAEMIGRHAAGAGAGGGEVDDDDGADMDEVLLVTQVLQVKEMAEQVSRQARMALGSPSSPSRENGDESSSPLSVMSQEEHYKNELGPLRFDIVDDLDQHFFGGKDEHKQHPTGLDTRRLFRELTAYRQSLPVEYGSSIFVRAVDGRLDWLRALITGPEGTPYANGCYLFDIVLPSSYPKTPPKVQFLTTGGGKVRFNPNLYNDGKVCLSLLGTWAGPGWVSGESTLLQVLVSIQSLIFVPDPFYNEPGFQRMQGTSQGEKQSEAYDANIRRHTRTLCIEKFLADAISGKHAYPEFADVITKHFVNKRAEIERQVKEWAQQDTSSTYASRNVCAQLSELAAQKRPPQRSRQRVVARGRKRATTTRSSAKHSEVIELVDDSTTKKIKAGAISSSSSTIVPPRSGPTEVIEVVDDEDEDVAYNGNRTNIGSASDVVVDLT